MKHILNRVKSVFLGLLNQGKMDKGDTYIDIKNGSIDYAFIGMYRKEQSGLYSWYIPSFDIYFSAESLEDGEKRAKAVTHSFINYWIKIEGFKNFLDKIERLGFKPESRRQISAVLRNRRNSVIYMQERPVKSEEFKNASIFKSVASIRA